MSRAIGGDAGDVGDTGDEGGGGSGDSGDSADTGDGLEKPYWQLATPRQSGIAELLRRAPASLRPLIRIVRRTAPRAALATAGLQVVSGVASAFALIAVAHLFALLLAGHGLADLAPSLALVGLLYLARGSLDATVSLVNASLGPAVLRAAQEELCDAALGVELAALDEPDFHDRLHRARDFGLTHLQQGTYALVQLAGSATAVAGAAAALAVLHPVLVAVLPLAVLPGAWGELRAAQLGHRGVGRTVALTRRQWMIADLVAQRPSAAEIRANQAEDFVAREYLEVADALRDQAVAVGRTQARAKAAGRALSGAGFAASFAVLAALTARGWLPLAAAGTAVVAIRSAAGALAATLLALGQLLEHGLYIADLRDFQDEARRRRLPQGGLPVRPPREIVVDGVGFRYPGADRQALRDVSLTIRAGQIVALVGENGSGKTTLAKLLAGLYRPGAGEIRWDGVATARLDPRGLADHVMIMQQEPVRWPHAARTNVRIGRHDRDDPADAALLSAAREARADEIVRDLPQGWQTLLSKYFQGGRELSGGQWQRFAVARGLFRDAPVLIWDEPTAPLDAEAEYAVYESLRRAARDRTVVLITHRLASVRHVDRIYLLEGGAVVEQGRHEELVALGGRYAQAFALQERMRAGDAWSEVEAGVR